MGGASEQATEADQESLRRNLARVPLRVSALLETPLPASDLLQLKVGDVISLGTPVRMPVELHVSGTRKFTGTLTRTEHGTGLTIQTAAARAAARASV